MKIFCVYISYVFKQDNFSNDLGTRSGFREKIRTVKVPTKDANKILDSEIDIMQVYSYLLEASTSIGIINADHHLSPLIFA